ncbi:MAG TPA: MBL fold metallo-hydrolase [Ktedonobacterales bacterium]
MQQVPPDEANEVKRLARDDDGPEQVEPGIWRIPLPLPFALRWANVYLIAGAGEYVLVDAGMGIPEDEAALASGLARAGIGLEKISTLVLTHSHPDHIGLSGPVQAASGAPVRMLAREAERLFQVWGDPDLAAFVHTNAMYAAHGMPAAELERALRVNRGVARAIFLPPRATVVPLADGDTLHLAGMDYTAIWTPGHADYHLCLLRADGVLIAGDHILPRITPNIGLYPEARPNPLRDYYESLARVRDLPVRLVLPGHGRPFANLAGRVDELRRHHEERADQTLAALAAYPSGANAYTLAAALFGARLRNADDHRFALVETLAHLEDLRARGRVERIAQPYDQGERITYVARTVAGGASRRAGDGGAGRERREGRGARAARGARGCFQRTRPNRRMRH